MEVGVERGRRDGASTPLKHGQPIVVTRRRCLDDWCHLMTIAARSPPRAAEGPLAQAARTRAILGQLLDCATIGA